VKLMVFADVRFKRNGHVKFYTDGDNIVADLGVIKLYKKMNGSSFRELIHEFAVDMDDEIVEEVVVDE